MQSLAEYQQIFNSNIIGGVIHYLLNNPIISWDNGFIQGMTGLCFLIALLDALGSLGSSKEFARKILTMALCLLVVLMNFGQINPRSIIDFDLQEYDYMQKPPLPPQMRLDAMASNTASNRVATLDRDIFNALAKFFNGVSSSLRQAIDKPVKLSATRGDIEETIQTYAMNETLYLLEQARNAKFECSSDAGNTEYIKCLNKYIPLGAGSNVTENCDGGDCKSAGAEAEKDDEGGSMFMPKIVETFVNMLMETYLRLTLIFSDIIFALVFPIALWLLEAIRSVVSLFLLIGYGLATAGMIFFAKLITPFLLLPKERKNVISAYRTLYAITLFGFVVDIFLFFTTVLMMGLHYGTYEVMKIFFSDAATAATSTSASVAFTAKFTALLMMTYFTIIVILIINIMALSKVKSTCLSLASFSFSKLVNVGNELVGASIKGAVAASAAIGGAAVMGPAIAGVLAKGGASGLMKGTATGRKLSGFAKGQMDKSPTLQGFKNVGNKISQRAGQLKDSYQSSSVGKGVANMNLGAREALFGDKGERAMLTRNIDNTVLKDESSAGEKSAEQKKTAAKKITGDGNNSGGSSGSSGSSGGDTNQGDGVSAKKVSEEGIGRGGSASNFDTDQGSSGQAPRTTSGGGESVVDPQGSNRELKSARDYRQKAKGGFLNSKLFTGTMAGSKMIGDKASRLISAGQGSGNVGDFGVNSLGSNIQKGIKNTAQAADSKYDEYLDRVSDNEELLEQARNSVDLTDSSITAQQTEQVLNELGGMTYESNIEKINQTETNIRNMDIYDSEGNFDESKLTEENKQEIYNVVGNFSKDSVDNMSEDAQERIRNITQSESYTKFREGREQQIQRRLNQYAQNKTFGNAAKISQMVSSGIMTKAQLDRMTQGPAGIETQRLLSEARKESLNEEFKKIDEQMNSGDSAAIQEASDRLDLVYNDSKLRDDSFTRNLIGDNSKVDILERAGKIDEQLSERLKTSRDFESFQNQNKDFIDSLAMSSSGTRMIGGLELNSELVETEDDSMEIQNFKYEGETIPLNDNGQVLINELVNSDQRLALSNLKSKIETLLSDKDLSLKLSQPDIEMLEDFNKKLVL